MKKTILFYALIIMIIISSALPYFSQDLFVEKPGHFSFLNYSTVLLLIAGLLFNWKYIKEIIIALYAFSFILTIGILINQINNQIPFKTGLYLLSVIMILILIVTIILRRLDKAKK